MRPAHHALGAVGAELFAQGRRSAALPDDRPVDRRAGRAVPHDGRLALVRDPDRGDLGPGYAGLRERRPGRPLDGRPDLLRIVLDPAGLRIVLRELGVAPREHAAVEIDDERGRSGGALIESKNVATGAHRPVSRFARSGRSLITTSTPRSTIRRMSRSSLTVHAESRIPRGARRGHDVGVDQPMVHAEVRRPELAGPAHRLGRARAVALDVAARHQEHRASRRLQRAQAANRLGLEGLKGRPRSGGRAPGPAPEPSLRSRRTAADSRRP